MYLLAAHLAPHPAPLRAMLGTRWDATTWTTVKAELKKALEMRSRIQRAG